MENNKNQEIFKDYRLKIKEKTHISNSGEISENINNLIIFLNWCFLKRNNFFIDDFNKKNIFSVCKTYNQLKTNILSKEYFIEYKNIFEKIDIPNIKTLKFILNNYVNNFNVINTDTKNTELCQKVSKDSMKSCLTYLEKIH